MSLPRSGSQSVASGTVEILWFELRNGCERLTIQDIHLTCLESQQILLAQRTQHAVHMDTGQSARLGQIGLRHRQHVSPVGSHPDHLQPRVQLAEQMRNPPFRTKAADYENKAVLLLQRAHKGELDPAEADRLAGEALRKKAENEAHAARSASEQEKFEQLAAQMDQSITTLKSTISQWENELKTLKARVTVSTATITINKQLAQLDSSGTVALLERMKEKIAVQEALAESYGEIAQAGKSVDAEIDKALGTPGASQASEDLKALKAKLGYTE